MEKQHIENFLDAIWESGDVREIRIFNKDGFVDRSGYFDSAQLAAKEVYKLTKENSVYVTLNPVKKACLARAKNKIIYKRKGLKTTTDKEIDEIKYLLIDCDPERPVGISSNDEELTLAEETADKIIAKLGNPLIYGMSGNGYHLIYRLKEKISSDQVKNFLQNLQQKFGNEKIKIDTSVFNPSRITKVLGTHARKGDNTEERPHRLSFIEKLNKDSLPISLPEIKAISQNTTTSIKPQGKSFNLPQFLLENNINVKETKPWNDATMHTLHECIFDPSHKPNEASIIQHPDGKIIYQCFHNSCKNKTWPELREQIGKPRDKRNFCKYCSCQVTWDNKTPYNLDGSPHRETCSHWLAKQKQKEHDNIQKNAKEKEIVEIGDCTGIMRNGKFFPLCYFSLKVIKKAYDEELGTATYIIQAKAPEMRVAREFEITGATFLNSKPFRHEITNRGFRVRSELWKNFDALLDYWLIGDIPSVKKTNFIGRIEEDTFLMDDALITKKGVMRQDKYICPKSYVQFRNGCEDAVFKSLTKKITDIYGKESWKIFGFCVGTLFVREIVDEYSCFPLFFIEAQKGKGKNTLSDIMKSLFGAKLTKNFNFSSTTKGFQRALAKHMGLPTVMNEYNPVRKNNQLIRSIYDREGYIRAKSDNTNDYWGGEINSSAIILSTRGISGDYADEVMSRVVYFSMDNVVKDKKKIREIKEQMSGLSEFIHICMTKITKNNLIEKIENYRSLLMSCSEVEERLIETHAIMLGCASCFFDSIGVDFFDQINLDEIVKQLNSHQRETDKSNVGQNFIDILEGMIYAHSIPDNVAKIDYQEKEIRFSLRLALPFVKKYANGTGIEIPDEKTIGTALRDIGFTVAQNRTGLGNKKLDRVWSRKIEDDQLPQEEKSTQKTNPEPREQDYKNINSWESANRFLAKNAKAKKETVTQKITNDSCAKESLFRENSKNSDVLNHYEKD